MASRRATIGFSAYFPVHAVAFSRDGHSLALAGGARDHTVQLWSLAATQKIAAFRGHTDIVNWVAFSPDGKTLASASDDKTIRLWDVATRGSVAVLRGHTRTVASVAFSPDGKTPRPFQDHDVSPRMVKGRSM
jgi:WD40 repeat protein